MPSIGRLSIPDNLCPRTLTAAAVAACGFCASAQAQQVTIGQLATQPENLCSAGQFDVLQVVATAGSYAAPSAGVVTSWSINAAASQGQVGSFKVLRAAKEGGYRVVASDRAKSLLPGMNTFRTALPVLAGDLIGMAYNAGPEGFACRFPTTDPGDQIGAVAGDTADGGLLGSPAITPTARLNLSAAFLPAPTVVTVSPPSGTVAGGTRVLIAGANFADVKGVTFGSTPAVGFRVESESQIAAVAPASGALGDATVTVTTAAGNAAGTFTYKGCLVPRLRGVRLARAKALLRKAECALGRLRTPRGPKARRARVVSQDPRPATVLPPRARVSVVLR